MIIKRVPFTNIEEILLEYSEKGEPVIIENFSPNTGCFNWTPEMLSQRCGDSPVALHYSRTGNVELQSEILNNMTFGDYLDNKLEDERYCIQQACLAEDLPDLLTDIPVPLQSLLDKYRGEGAHIWVSGKDGSTPLHFDKANNFFMQCFGSKKFVLFSAEQTDYLHPYESGDNSHVSQVNDIHNPDLELFPLFAKAEPMEVIVHPGDVLFMPTGVWHHVTGLSTSISMNIWFDSFDFQATSTVFTRTFASDYEHLVEEMTTELTPYKYPGPLNFCGQFSTKGLYFESCICHIALLEYEINQLFPPNQFTGGNLENSINLCRQNRANLIDSKTVDEIIEIFKFGQELLAKNSLNCTDERALSICDSVRKHVQQITALR